MVSPESLAVERRVNAFLLAEAFSDSQGFLPTQQKLLSEAGVYDLDAEELALMRITVLKHNHRESLKQRE